MAPHRFTLTEPVHLDTQHELLGAVEVDFPAGEVEPRSEHEEHALELLATRHPQLATKGEAMPDPEPAGQSSDEPSAAPVEGLPGRPVAASGPPGPSLPDAGPGAANQSPQEA